MGSDVVEKPDHYMVGGFEALDVVRAKLTPEEYRGFLKGNVLKYIMRANYKGHHDVDCAKAEFYSKELNRAIKEEKAATLGGNEIEVREKDCRVPF